VTDDTRIGMAILTNSVYSSNSIGTDIRNNINIITTPMTLQSCMGIAFAAAHSAHNATVSCHNNSGYSALVAVYDCKRQYRASDGSEGIFCRKTF
ncbi:MAG: hypothetical protein KKA05_04935, partial [Alphaproteobacteria bacterium]|nr:hypothetical protein [Alphaproteobacteria bacterium]